MLSCLFELGCCVGVEEKSVGVESLTFILVRLSIMFFFSIYYYCFPLLSNDFIFSISDSSHTASSLSRFFRHRIHKGLQRQYSLHARHPQGAWAAFFSLCYFPFEVHVSYPSFFFANRPLLIYGDRGSTR